MVRNINSSRSGRAVANQFVITTNEGTYFQSYNSVIAKVDKEGRLTLSHLWDYSVTTSKYLYQFIKEYWCRDYYSINKKWVAEKLKEGEILYQDTIKM